MIFVYIIVAILSIINSGCTPQTGVPVPTPATVERSAPIYPVTPIPVASPTVLPTVAPRPNYPVTELQFIYFNAAGICGALSNWDGRVTTIVFPVVSSPTALIYTFEEAGVFIGARNGFGKAPLGYGGGTQVIQVDGGTSHVVCTVTVTNGHFEGVR